jgi:hypothetical protein
MMCNEAPHCVIFTNLLSLRLSFMCKYSSQHLVVTHFECVLLLSKARDEILRSYKTTDITTNLNILIFSFV